MKFFSLILLVVICKGSAVEEPPKNVELSTYRNHSESGFVVTWSPVENESDPVLGYKVSIWEEKTSFGYELKDDGTMDPKTTEQIPRSLFDGNVYPMYELKENGEFVPLEMQYMMWKIWQTRAKVVYKLNHDGTLQSITAADIPVLKLRHDSTTKLSEIDVPATESTATFNGTKRSYIYEVAVQAYTASSTGPLSNKIKIVTY